MIEFRNVSFSYPDGADGGLKNIDITIPDGQCVLLCGRSGCGKTTLTRLLNGLIPQFFAGELTGEVLLDGENIFSLPMYRIAEKVGSVFQNPRTQFFNVDTDSEIAFGIENEALPPEELKRRVAETAQALRIESLLGRSIFALSGGEKQKIAFASVYAMQPEVYLLDEPSSNLDSDAIDGLREHIRLIKSQGKTVIIAEHRLYYLNDVADRIIYLENGCIAGDWTPELFAALPASQRQAVGLRALRLLEELGLAAYQERHPNTLSGGQKQRLAAAGSMVCGKELLVFDEPTSGLDYDSMVCLAVLIRRLADSGKTIFIVTHDYEFICRTCTRVLHLAEGTVGEDLPVTAKTIPRLREIFNVR